MLRIPTSSCDEAMMGDDASEERRKAKDAARYKKNVANGKQEVYDTNQRNRRREERVRKMLHESKMHLLQPVLRCLSKHKRVSDNQIQTYIRACELEYKRAVAARVSARSDDGHAASTSMPNTGIQTATRSTEDTPNQVVPANKPPNADRSTSPTASENTLNFTAAVTAADAPAVITPDKPEDGQQTSNDAGGDPSALPASEDKNGLSEDDDFINFSDTDDNYDNVSPSSIEPSASESEQESESVPTKKKRRLTREVDALARSLPGSLPLDGNDWTISVQPMALWKAYGLDKVPQQPTSISLHNSGQFPFYEEGTGILRIDLCFVPPNTRFPNDGAMDGAATAARALIADEFGGDELLNQRDRKYSAPNFHTVFYIDKTCTVCSAIHDQGINHACETYSPTNNCISVAYFTQLEGTGEDRACLWIEWLVTAKTYRNKKLGIGKLLLENILHLAITDDGVDSVYLEVGSGNGDWEAARHVYDSVGFDVVSDLSALPKSVEEQCKHHGDRRYDVLRFDCEKNKNMFEGE